MTTITSKTDVTNNNYRKSIFFNIANVEPILTVVLVVSQN